MHDIEELIWLKAINKVIKLLKWVEKINEEKLHQYSLNPMIFNMFFLRFHRDKIIEFIIFFIRIIIFNEYEIKKLINLINNFLFRNWCNQFNECDKNSFLALLKFYKKTSLRIKLNKL